MKMLMKAWVAWCCRVYFSLTMICIHQRISENIFSSGLSFTNTGEVRGRSGRVGTIFFPLYNFHPLANIQIFTWNSAWEMTTFLNRITCNYQTDTRWDLTLQAPIPQNDLTHSNNSSANSRRIAWVRLTILWDWRLKD